MKNNDEELVQLNARVPEETKRIARVAAALIDCNIEVLVADALKSLVHPLAKSPCLRIVIQPIPLQNLSRKRQLKRWLIPL